MVVEVHGGGNGGGCGGDSGGGGGNCSGVLVEVGGDDKAPWYKQFFLSRGSLICAKGRNFSEQTSTYIRGRAIRSRQCWSDSSNGKPIRNRRTITVTGIVDFISRSPELDNVTAQDTLREKLITEDSFAWKLPSTGSTTNTPQGLRYVGGVDISFSKDDPSKACGTLVVLDFQTLQVVYQDFSLVTLQVPYVPGFLAFREAPVLLDILEKMKKSDNPFYPQLLMVDGNGILHPRGFGLACHIGVMANLPTIGIGKNLHHVDGLDQSRVRTLLGAKENSSKDFIPLVGCSGHIWGVAMRTTQGSIKPIFISIGHRISLQTAITIVQMTCNYRVPEPIRQADIRSRDYIRKFEMNPKMK